jgi:hypothetical protein
MSGVLVTMHFKDRKVGSAHTNVNGFANFASSISDESVSMKEPGAYRYKVHPPPGWKITSDNGKQVEELIEVPRSPSGFGFKQMPEPVGISPVLSIRGQLNGSGSESIELIQDDEVVKTTETDRSGDFVFKVQPGKYRVEVSGRSLNVTVDSVPVDIGTIRSEQNTIDGPVEDETLITFDNLTETSLWKVPNNYKNLRWFNLNIMRSRFTGGSIGYVNGQRSEDFILYTSSGHPGYIRSQSEFNFHSVYLTSAWPEAHDDHLTVEYWRHDRKIAEDLIELGVFGPVLYRPNLKGVTKVRFSMEHYWQAVFDNMKVSGLR